MEYGASILFMCTVYTFGPSCKLYSTNLAEWCAENPSNTYAMMRDTYCKHAVNEMPPANLSVLSGEMLLTSVT